MKIQSNPSQPQLPRRSLANRISQGLGKGMEAVFDFNHTLSAVPKFIYPTVTGTPAQQALVWGALDKMPMHHAVRPVSIEVLPEFPGTPGTLGSNKSPIGSITINQAGYGMQNPANFQNTVNHEVGHSVDHSGGIFSTAARTRPSDSAPFGAGPNVSDYAGTNPKEDFAESYELHRHDPARLREINPEKADVMERLDQPSLLEKLVDRPAYRETGKWIAHQFEAIPKLRTGLELLRQGSIATLGLTGAAQVGQGLVSHRGNQVAQGLLQAGACGSLIMAPQHPWLGLVAAASLGATRGIQVAESKGADGARVVTSALGAAAGGVVGGFVAPLALTELGFGVAGPVGGALGLVVGGLLGGQLGAKLGARAALEVTT